MLRHDRSCALKPLVFATISDPSDCAEHMADPDLRHQELDDLEDTRYQTSRESSLPPATVAEYDRLFLMFQTTQADQHSVT